MQVCAPQIPHKASRERTRRSAPTITARPPSYVAAELAGLI